MLLPTTILFVDDDLGVRAALAEALRLEDHSLTIVATVREAEDSWEQLGSARICLVIADLHLTAHLQGYEGYHLYERWHRRAPQLPFLFISGSPVSQDLPAVRTGAVRFLAKPFAFGDLLQAVREETHGGAKALRGVRPERACGSVGWEGGWPRSEVTASPQVPKSQEALTSVATGVSGFLLMCGPCA